MSLIENDLYEFGLFSLDPRERAVMRDGVRVSMTPKVFDTLLYLVENRGRVLTKDELLQKIWPGTFVEEVNLAVNISTLRKLLGENPQDGRYIVTVSGRGYRFVAEVRKTIQDGEKALNDEPPSGIRLNSEGIRDPAPPSGARRELADPARCMDRLAVDASQATLNPEPPLVTSPPARQSSIRLVLTVAFAAVLLLVAVSGSYWRWHKNRVPAVAASIAVLPFADLSPNGDQEYFSDGLADELTNDLAKVRGLKVVARSSAFQFKGKNEDSRTVGSKLGVATILEGSVRREGERVRITAELTKVDGGFQLWSETYDRKMNDVFAVQDEIARAVTVALQVRILDTERDADAAHFRRNPSAYEPYLQAQYFYARGEDKEDLDKALDYVDQAIKNDSAFAPAWALRSMIINTAATIGRRDHEESYREARQDAEKSIALDARCAAGYIALASVKTVYEWDWDGTEAALRKASELLPGSAVVMSFRAYLYESLGRLDEAIALTEEANALDPLRTNAYLGALLYSAGRYSEARTAVEKALAINSKLEGAHSQLGQIFLAQGNAQDALGQMELEPGEWQRLTGEALVYHALNRPQVSDAALLKLIAAHAEDAPYQVAEIYAYREQTGKAFEWLERAYRKRDPGLNQLKLDPLLKTLRSDPRYLDLVRRMRLPL